MSPTIVLASASPARASLLRGAGLDPVIMVSTVDEDAVVAEVSRNAGKLVPADIALVLARAKAEDVADHEDAQDALVIGCDSVLEFAGQVLGKPGDAETARTRLAAISGGTGVLHTGHWVVDTRETPPDGEGTGATTGVVVSTVVHVATMSAAEIDAYVTTGEPIHVAGGLTIDGLGSAFVAGIEGDHTNVIGLSIPAMRTLLDTMGVQWTSLWVPAASAHVTRGGSSGVAD